MSALYNVELMATLWGNTYRAMVTNDKGEYIATLRLIVNLPRDRSEVPAEAPEVPPQLFVLVEDAVIQSSEIISLETAVSKILLEKFENQIPQCFFFYPSPEDMLSKTSEIQPH